MKGWHLMLRILGVIVLALVVVEGWNGYWDRAAFRKAPTVEEAYQSLAKYSAGEGWQISDLLPADPEEYKWRGNARLRIFSPPLEPFALCRFSRGEHELTIIFSGRSGRAVKATTDGYVEQEDIIWISKALPKTRIDAVPTMTNLY